MQIILGEDGPPHRSRYQAVLGQALAAAWRSAGWTVQHVVPDSLGGFATDAGAATAAAARLLEAAPAARVHLLTTGPLAQALARACVRAGRPFTSTSEAASPAAADDPEFARALGGVHGAAAAVVTPAPAAARRLLASGVRTGVVVTAGVDTQVFQPRVYGCLELPRPVTLLLGLPGDSNILREFLETPLPGTRLVHAPGWTGLPELAGGVHVFGHLPPGELAALISAADVCVVPDTGPESLLLSLQSLACGVPVASQVSEYTETLLQAEALGAVDDDLGRGVTRALRANRQLCRGTALRYSWQAAARRILAAGETPRRAAA